MDQIILIACVVIVFLYAKKQGWIRGTTAQQPIPSPAPPPTTLTTPTTPVVQITPSDPSHELLSRIVEAHLSKPDERLAIVRDWMNGPNGPNSSNPSSQERNKK